MAEWWEGAPEVKRAPAAPRPTNRTTPAAQALGGSAPAQPPQPQPRAPQAAAEAAQEWWSAAPLVEQPAAPPEPRQVGFAESAGRVAGSSAIPVVQTAGMAVGGALEIAKKVAAVADTLAPIFGLKPDMSLRVQQAQEATFRAADERAQSMRDMYAPQPGEQFDTAGSIAGGVASMPIEVAGGFGLQRGVGRAADVIDRGGSVSDAAIAGGVSGAANIAANLLPVKAGGLVGRAVEGGLARVLPGGAKAGAIVGGGATGAAMGVGADVGVTAAENATLPEGGQFADLQREASPAVAGGLGGALGAVAGAVTKGKARPVRAPVPAAEPTAGTQGSVGAAGTDVATQRRERAASLPEPIELTKGQAERTFEQQQFERETAKDAKTGEPLRQFFGEQNAKVKANLDALVDLTGAETADPYTAGNKVAEALAKKAGEAKAKVDAEYQRAREAGEMSELVPTDALVTKLREIEPSATNAPVIKAAEAELVRLGGAERAKDGSLVPGKLSLNDFEELRKTVSKNGAKDATNALFARDLKSAIDMATENAGGDIYRGARKMYRDYAAEFKNRAIVADLIGFKKGSDERKVAFENVYRRTVKTGSVDELGKLRDTLRGAGPEGQQAWRELQGQAMGEIRDAALKNTSRNERGDPIVSAAGMDRSIRELDKAGKLELLFGKKGAETLRDLNDLAKDVYTSPPGSVNFSGTASALKNLIDRVVTFQFSGIPVEVGGAIRAIRNAWQSRAMRKQVEAALPKKGEPLLRKPMAERPFEPPEPPAPPAPPESTPNPRQPSLFGKKPEPKPEPIPVGEARELPPEPPATGRAPDLPELPVPEVVEPIPVGEAAEVDLEAWRREFNIPKVELPRAEALDRALDVDEAAARAAAVQHQRSPVAFDRAIDRILEKGESNANQPPEAARSGARAEAPAPGVERQEADQGSNRQGEGPAAQAQEVETPVRRAIRQAREAFDKATEPTGNPVTDALSRKLRDDYEGAVREYDALPDSEGGTVLNADTARELSPDYIKNRALAADVHDPASAFVARLYAERLAEPTPAGKDAAVMFTAGGTGAGKSSGLSLLPDESKRQELTYDTTMSKLSSSVEKIEQALAAGRDVRIIYTYARPQDAIVQALRRAEGMRKEFGSGRTVPIDNFIQAHVGSSRVIRDLADKYRHNLRVQILAVDNSRGKGQQQFAEVADLPLVRDNGLREEAASIARALVESGDIGPETFFGFFGGGKPASLGKRGLAADVPRQPDQGPAARPSQDRPARVEPPAPRLSGPIGKEAPVSTERGMRVATRFRLVDMGELRTSHTDALGVNPDFPPELQPRDRTRAASEDQIARIENAINPELLADSPKAGDGAPIVGDDGIVESGNARTIALRRAYGSGKAEGYRAWLADNAEKFGLQADQVRGMKQPVLVRERITPVDRAEFARQANESTVATMSDSEQALSDSRVLPDLELLVGNEDGTISIARSNDFIRQFMLEVASQADRGRMLTADGSLSQYGHNRIRNAVFAKAYGDSSMVEMLTDEADGNVKNVVSGMLRAAARVAKVRELSEAGARQPADFVPDVVEAARRFAKVRAEGLKVEQALAKRDLLGGDPSERVQSLMLQLEIDSRAPRRIADMVQRMADEIDAAGDPRQAALLEPRAEYRTGKLADDLDAQQRFLTDRAEAAGFKTIDEWAGQDFDGFMRAADDWRQQNPADVLREPNPRRRDATPEDVLRELWDSYQKGGSVTEQDLLNQAMFLIDEDGGTPALKKAAEAYNDALGEEYSKWGGRGEAVNLGDAFTAELEKFMAQGGRELREPGRKPMDAPQFEAMAERMGFDRNGPGPGEWVKPISGLGDVVMRQLDGDKVEVRAEYMGRDLGRRVAIGDAAIGEAVQRAIDGIQAGREKIARKFIADESGLPQRESRPLLRQQTADELRQRDADRATAEKAAADEQKRLADKAKADAQLGEFTLTGSDRQVDVAAAAGQGSLFEPGKRYAVRDRSAPYTTDLFGDPVEAPAITKKPAPAGLGPRDTMAPPGDYFIRTVVGTPTERELGASKVVTAEDAARATAYLYRSAVERMDGIVTDKAGKPLAVIGGFKGAVSEASAYPATLVAEAVRIPGAARIWFSHNHPSGTAHLSSADEKLWQTLRGVFEGSGIEPQGLLAVAGDRYASIGGGSSDRDVSMPKPGPGAKVPVIEREQVEPQGRRGWAAIQAPSEARAAAEALYKQATEPGIMLLDAQHRMAAWVPLPNMAVVGKLKGTGGLNAIYRAVSESNASNAIIVHGGELDWQPTPGLPMWDNIASALKQVDVRPLDVIDVKQGRSGAERGDIMGLGRVFGLTALGAAGAIGAAAQQREERKQKGLQL